MPRGKKPLIRIFEKVDTRCCFWRDKAQAASLGVFRHSTVRCLKVYFQELHPCQYRVKSFHVDCFRAMFLSQKFATIEKGKHYKAKFKNRSCGHSYMPVRYLFNFSQGVRLTRHKTHKSRIYVKAPYGFALTSTPSKAPRSQGREELLTTNKRASACEAGYV